MDKGQLFKAIPSFDALLHLPKFAEMLDQFGRKIVVNALRKATDHVRGQIASGVLTSGDDVAQYVLDETCRLVNQQMRVYYRKAINATGIILHTALGRAVLPQSAINQIVHHLSGYAILQYDQETGKRGHREAKVESLLQELTHCEAATLVNNNAAATIIALNTIAAGKEVIVSRGQLVEIGGAFRLPEIMAISGVTMREVGTTNKTHLRDYEAAINENTAAILRVHPSNYRIHGFTSSVSSKELCDLAHRHGLCFIDDIGAGALVDFSKYGFEKEPTIQEEVAIGADVITCSGDKLISSVQSGLILGKSEWLKRIRKNPLARALRVDKLTLGGMEASLKLFLDEQIAMKEVPTLAMLQRTKEDIAQQARRIMEALPQHSHVVCSLKEDYSQMGSGSLPEQNLETVVLTLEVKDADGFAAELRNLEVPIIPRIKDNKIYLDPRTILPGEEEILIRELNELFGS